VIKFDIKGEGSIVGNAEIMANPVKVEWGTAPVIVRPTTKPGEITITATVLDEGTHTPSYGEITFSSIASTTPLLFNKDFENKTNSLKGSHSDVKIEDRTNRALKRRILELEKALNEVKLKEVENQQEEFEGGE
jgi:beta-galactosidase